MTAVTDLTPQQIEAEATKFGLSPEESKGITVHDFGVTRSITVYPGGKSPKPELFLCHLVKRGPALPNFEWGRCSRTG